MEVTEIQNARVQGIIDRWKQALQRQETNGDVFGILGAREVKSPEVQQAIKHFEGQGLSVTIKKNRLLSVFVGGNTEYDLIFKLTGSTSPLA